LEHPEIKKKASVKEWLMLIGFVTFLGGTELIITAIFFEC